MEEWIMQVTKYFAGALMVLSAIVFTGCSDKSDGSPDKGKPSTQTSAKIQFVSTLTDATLLSSSNTETIENYIKNTLSDGKTIVLLDRTDQAGVADIAKMMQNTKKFSAFVVHSQNSTADFDVSSIIFNTPSANIAGYQITSDCYVNGLDADLGGTVKNLDAEGNITNSNDVTVSVPFYSCRFDTQEQINAFTSNVLGQMKTANVKNIIIGTVSNSLFETLKTAVPSADSAYSVAEVKAGTDYTIFMLYQTRYWGYNGVTETSVASGITAYSVDIAWK